MNIDGVTVLTSRELTSAPMWMKWVFIGSLLIMFSSIIIMVIFYDYDKKILSIAPILGGIGLAIGIILAIVIIIADDVHLNGKIQYDCLVEESAITQVYKEYKIVDFNGPIWTVEDK